MKKDSIVKMLKTLKSKGTDVNISIVEMLLLKNNPEGVKRQALIDVLAKDLSKGRIVSALQSLNKKGVIMETKVKTIVRVSLTPTAWVELLGAEAGKKVAELLSEGEKILKDVTVLAKKEGSDLKKKTLKKLSKGVEYMKEIFREVTK
jgi:hypothetical protein